MLSALLTTADILVVVVCCLNDGQRKKKIQNPLLTSFLFTMAFFSLALLLILIPSTETHSTALHTFAYCSAHRPPYIVSMWHVKAAAHKFRSLKLGISSTKQSFLIPQKFPYNRDFSVSMSSAMRRIWSDFRLKFEKFFRQAKIIKSRHVRSRIFNPRSFLCVH